MLELEEIYRVERCRGIIALEGWDAAGKSGAIRRQVEKLDPRRVQVWPIRRPSPDEQGRHYLWRFWQRLPPPGQIADLRPQLVRPRPRRRAGPAKGMAPRL
jgi:AMP-polyphosphate phosphotransferase